MKILLTFLSVIVLSISSYAQITVNQSISPVTNLKVGDTITVKYTIDKGTSNPRYFWLRYQYNNKALSYVNNSTSFSQGTSTQTYYTGWNNYIFTPKTSIDSKDLYQQYLSSPWGYSVNNDWNVGQLTVQRTDASINGDIATQKFIIKDLNDYSSIHKLDLSYSINDVGTNVSTVTTTGGTVSLTNVIGNTSQFKVRVLFPSSYTNITDHSVQLMYLKNDDSGDIDWTRQPIAVKQLDGTGEAVFTSGVRVGDSVGVFVGPAFQKSYMNNIVTVSDAYKAFLGITQMDINGETNYFQYPNLEKKVGLITKNKSTFSESDSYYLFSYVMGVDVTSSAMIPTSTSTSIKWQSGLLNQSWLDGVAKNKVTITSPIQVVDAVYAWGGDLDWSHSSSPSEISSRIASGNYVNSVNVNNTIKTMSLKTNSYSQPTLETATLSVSSKLENNKVILTTTLSKEGLAGLEVIMNYDSTKLTLDNIVFDSGNTITNFTTDNNGRLTFGSIDQTKTSRIKIGTPYKLIFTPKTTLTNTSGLFYFVLSDAVDGNGNKINLIVD